MVAKCSPGRVHDGVWLHKQPSPAVLQFKVKTVGVHLKVYRSSLYKEPVLELLLEDDVVKVPGLSKLTRSSYFRLRN